jgi:hypothetical protein
MHVEYFGQPEPLHRLRTFEDQTEYEYSSMSLPENAPIAVVVHFRHSGLVHRV